MIKRFGWVPRPDDAARFVEGLQYPHIAQDLPHLMSVEKRDVYLWLPLLTVQPSWERAQQLIGDCVSFGHELVCTMLMAMQHVSGESEWEATGATEAIYGGCRCEVNGGRSPISGDGAVGAWAAEWLKDYGVLLRKDYSPLTGNKDHNLTSYSGQRAKDWGSSGCGGRNDKGKLDEVARKFPVKEVSQVRTVEEAAAAIDHGCPVSICSGVGFGQMARNSDGVVRRSGSWAHCMMLGGVRYKSGEPQFRIFQSWGQSCSGPDPGIEHSAVSDCSWWAVAEDVERILREDDSYAFSRVEGFALPPWDWRSNFFV